MALLEKEVIVRLMRMSKKEGGTGPNNCNDYAHTTQKIN